MKNKKMNWQRRAFIKKSTGALLGAAAFPFIVPSRVLAGHGGISPSDRITIGCIGVGSMGTANLKSFLSKDDARVVAVCDLDASRRDNAKKLVDEKYGNQDCQTYHDFRELLARPDIDAIMTATPDHWHALVTVAAARAGKDLYAEKPLAYTIAEGRAIVDAVNRYGIVWQTGSWQRSHRHFRFACELVRNGRIGKVHTVRVGLPFGNSVREDIKLPDKPSPDFDYEMWLGPAPWRPYHPGRIHWNFRWISDYSQGQLTDWAGHHCDIANWAMDTEHSAPVSIEGKATYPKAVDGLYDTAEKYKFTCEYKEGFTMIVADESQQPRGMGAHFIGETGWVHVNRSGLYTSSPDLGRAVIEPGEIHLYKSEDHHQNFLDCVRSRKATVTPVEAAHHAIMVAHLGHIAMRTGRKLRWNLQQEKFVDDPDADRYLSRPMRKPWHL